MDSERVDSPPPERPVEAQNNLAVAGFICSLVGIVFTVGLLCPIGLILSLVALGRPGQRGFAIAGVLLGAFGTLGILLIFLFLGAAILAFLGLAVLALSGPERLEVTQDFFAILVRTKAYEDEYGHLPDDIDLLGLSESRLEDPWNNRYEYQIDPSRELGFELVSAGEDGEMRTDDDIKLSELGDYWEEAIHIDVDGFPRGEKETVIRLGERRLEIRRDEVTGDLRVWVDGQEMPLERALDQLLNERR